MAKMTFLANSPPKNGGIKTEKYIFLVLNIKLSIVIKQEVSNS